MTERVFRVNIERDLPPQFFYDILTTAAEGGIAYWADYRVKRAEDLSVTEIYDLSDAESGEQFPDYVDVFDIFRAVQDVVARRAKVSSWVREAVLSDVETGESGCRIDADVADVLVQLALFGEVVYG